MPLDRNYLIQWVRDHGRQAGGRLYYQINDDLGPLELYDLPSRHTYVAIMNYVLFRQVAEICHLEGVKLLEL